MKEILKYIRANIGDLVSEKMVQYDRIAKAFGKFFNQIALQE